ncbi:Long-chain specific acyl-CoA dehydrogenase, mitochondrial [Microtus ochrogaster]|uniref:Long-chain specific acyl-CoA dehydrogenase, mitochondrial n=1 Tax=Microtus ochrogaster TaxID=79684 RepID=A0A8J6KN64_MICOH|nr:Long-chain specific acyl-CoA dehydrogenase, mitochondrial [Microtus ochrogaster]
MDFLHISVGIFGVFVCSTKRSGPLGGGVAPFAQSRGGTGDGSDPARAGGPARRSQLAVPEARPAARLSRLRPPRCRSRAQSSAGCPAMAALLLLRSLRVLSARSAPRPPPSVRCSHSGADARLETPSAKKLTDIGIRRIFSTEHDIFRESVRKFFQEDVVPYHTEWEKAGEVSREVWEKAGKQGLLGVNIAEEHGGIGGDLYSTAITWEEQAYSNCTGPGFSLHSDIVMPYIANYGTKEQIERFIPQMTAGKCIGAIAMTEPGAGSDLQGVRTNAKRSGSDWILNGSKVFITNGWLSDLVIVVAITNREARSPAHGISLFLVENGMKGFIKGRKLHKMGMKAQDTAELFFEDVRLPASALLGEENKGFYYLMQELPQERLLIADLAISACEFMFEETRNYVKQRKAFGKTVAHIQLRQGGMLSDILMQGGFRNMTVDKMPRGECRNAEIRGGPTADPKENRFDGDVDKEDHARSRGGKEKRKGRLYPGPGQFPEGGSRAGASKNRCESQETVKSHSTEGRPVRTVENHLNRMISKLIAVCEQQERTVQHKLAELKTNICVTRAFVDSCLQLHEAKRLDSGSASMAKYWASELQNSVAYQCVQLHGGWGYMWEYPIAKAYVDARVQPIYGGTNEIMRELIARQIVSDS